MRLKRLVSAPKSRLWWPGALVVGLALPLALTVLFHFVGYFPPGRLFPDSSLWSGIAFLLILYVIRLVALATGIVWSLASWSWRPIALALLSVGGGYVAFWPAWTIGTAMRMSGFERVADRSAVLVNAIEAFARDHGAAPATLEALVPTYLAAVPSTGMAAGPTYLFWAEAGSCSDGNAWSIRVEQQAPPITFMFYCPKRDYEKSAWGPFGRPIGDWFLVTF